MFPKARELLGNEMLRELGAKMEARKAELMAMPSTKSLPSKLLGAVASAISPGSDADDDSRAINLDGTDDAMPSPAARKASGKSAGKGTGNRSGKR